MVPVRERLLVIGTLLVLLLVAFVLLFVAVQTRNGLWFLGAVVAFLALIAAWVWALVHLRSKARRLRGDRDDRDVPSL